MYQGFSHFSSFCIILKCSFRFVSSELQDVEENLSYYVQIKLFITYLGQAKHYVGQVNVINYLPGMAKLTWGKPKIMLGK